MKNQVFTSTLLKGLEAICKVNKVMKTSNKDIVTVCVSGDRMTVNSIDFVNQVVLTTEAAEPVEMEIGIVGAEKLQKALKKFDTFTSFELIDNKISITDGKKKIVLPITDPYKVTEYELNNAFTTGGIQLSEAYSKVKHAIAKDEARPILTGIHFKNNFIETVDGYRIAQVDITKETFSHEFTINKAGMELILPTCKKDKTDVQIDTYNNKCIMQTGNKEYTMTIISSLLDGEFLRTEQVFTNDYKYKLSFNDSKELVSEIEFIKDMMPDDNKKNPMRYLINKDSVSLADTTEDVSTKVAVNDIECKDQFKIAFNPNFMIDALKAIKDDFTMQFVDALRPCIIKNKECTEKYLVLPVRLNA